MTKTHCKIRKHVPKLFKIHWLLLNKICQLLCKGNKAMASTPSNEGHLRQKEKQVDDGKAKETAYIQLQLDTMENKARNKHPPNLHRKEE